MCHENKSISGLSSEPSASCKEGPGHVIGQLPSSGQLASPEEAVLKLPRRCKLLPSPERIWLRLDVHQRPVPAKGDSCADFGIGGFWSSEEALVKLPRRGVLLSPERVWPRLPAPRWRPMMSAQSAALGRVSGCAVHRNTRSAISCGASSGTLRISI